MSWIAAGSLGQSRAHTEQPNPSTLSGLYMAIEVPGT
jgi:hypothetical protein